jgi:hypothetical protein
LVIGFGHRARQGKNTAAQAVLDACPLDMQVRMYAFADALKTEVRKACCAFGGQYALIAAWKEAGLMPEWVQCEDPKPRTLLQWWGTEYRRSKDPDYWTTRLRNTLSEHNPDVALITDVRFPNEVEFIHGLGGYVVKVERLSKPDIAVKEHPSEAMLDGYAGWDFHIKAADLRDLQRQARAIYMGGR